MTRTWAPSSGSIVVQHRRGFVKNSAGWAGFRLGKRGEWTDGFMRRKRNGKRNCLKAEGT